MRGLYRLLQREGGFVLVFMAIALPAMLALIGLALDGVRLMSLDTEAANIADSAALAAANRLDRSPEALSNAREDVRALTHRITSDWRDGAQPRLALRFASSLEDLRRNPNYSLASNSGEKARYVEARVFEVTLTTAFLQLVGAHVASLERRAIAESKYQACGVTPAILCHPDPEAFAAQARPGRQYLLRMDGNDLAGSIALLDRPDTEDPRQVLRDLASTLPRFCYADGLRLRRTVAQTDYDAALNVRFDRYVGRNGPIDFDLAQFPPAPDIVQGRHLATCNSPPGGGDISPPYPLPRDSAYQGLQLSGLWDQGTGDWKVAPPLGGTEIAARSALDEYLLWNHANKGTDILDRLRNAPTRYDLYLAELGLTRQTKQMPVDTRSLSPATATMPTGGPTSGSLSFKRENAVPICYSGSQPATNPQRRVIQLTVADCGKFPAAANGEALSRHVAKFFLTEPSSLGITLVEFIGMLQPNEDGDKLRHIVQLVDAH